MKISDTEAHVCMGEGEVKAGDKVAFYKNVCSAPKPGGRIDASVAVGCKKVMIGTGEISQTLNEHYSVVHIAPGVQFKEGTIVEKQ